MALSKHLLPLTLIATLFLSSCARDDDKAAVSEPGPVDAPISADNEQTHEELQNPASGIITYGSTLPPGEEYHDVIVDGKPYKSLFTQKNLDLATRDSITREEYESAFLDLVTCIEDRGGWIHYNLDLEEIKYTHTWDTDPHGYCFTSHFHWASWIWGKTHYSDESDKIWFYINCLKNHDIEPVHAEPASESGPPQWDQSHELQVQVKEEGIDCGSYIDSFYDDAPYPE